MKNIDLNNLDFSNMGAWPNPVKVGFIVIVSLLVLVAGYFIDISGKLNELDSAHQQEVTLKADFEEKQSKAVNLEAYKRQMQEMQQSFGSMLRQLPKKTEVDDLLVDISQSGLSSGVEFSLFKPGQEQLGDFYAELPIQMSVSGSYHQFGSFVSSVAALPRIVTLHNITLAEKDSQMTMEVQAKTYRYLDQDEMLKHQREQKEKSKRR